MEHICGGKDYRCCKLKDNWTPKSQEHCEKCKNKNKNKNLKDIEVDCLIAYRNKYGFNDGPEIKVLETNWEDYTIFKNGNKTYRLKGRELKEVTIVGQKGYE